MTTRVRLSPHIFVRAKSERAVNEPRVICDTLNQGRHSLELRRRVSQLKPVNTFLHHTQSYRTTCPITLALPKKN